MNDYLRRATRGLWGRKKAEAKQELASHIFERTRQLTILGLSETEAQQTVLRELGAPEAVSRSLVSVHTLPVAFPALALALLIGSAGLITTQAAAQIQLPLLTKQSQLGVTHAQDLYADVDVFARAMRKAGVTVEGSRLRPILKLSGQKIALTSDDLTLGPDLYFQPDELKPQVYINLVGVAQAFERAGERVTVQGWENPTIQLGPATLQASGAPTLNAFKLYELQLINLAPALGNATSLGEVGFINAGSSSNPESNRRFRIRVNARPGEVFGLLTEGCASPNDLDMNRSFDAAYSFDIAPVAADGTLRFKLPYSLERLTFTTDPKVLTSAFQPCTRTQLRRGSPTQIKAFLERSAPVPAVIFKLSSTLTKAPTPMPVMPLQTTADGQ